MSEDRSHGLVLERPEALEVSEEFIARLRDDCMASERLVAAARRARLAGQIAAARREIGPDASDRQIAAHIGVAPRIVRRARRGHRRFARLFS